MQLNAALVVRDRYRSGHNGPDSKRRHTKGSESSKNLEFAGFVDCWFL